MFGNFRKKINSVIQDSLNSLSSSTSTSTSPSSPISPSRFFRNSTTSSSSSSDNTLLGDTSILSINDSKLHLAVNAPTTINLKAGSELLEQTENQWQQIHRLNVENANKADEIDQRICRINEQTEQQLLGISDLNQTLVAIPTLTAKLETCYEIIIDINRHCRNIEQKLMEFEDLMDVLELQDKQLNHRFEMAMYKEKKLTSLELVRQELANKHATSVREYEKQLRIVQQERQAAFQDAFQNDLMYYKEVGSIPKIQPKTTLPPVTLEEIILDDNTKDLDDFLNN